MMRSTWGGKYPEPGPEGCANHPDSPARTVTLQAQMTICIFNFSNLLKRDQTKQKKGSRVPRIDVAIDSGSDPTTPELVVKFFLAA